MPPTPFNPVPSVSSEHVSLQSGETQSFDSNYSNENIMRENYGVELSSNELFVVTTYTDFEKLGKLATFKS